MSFLQCYLEGKRFKSLNVRFRHQQQHQQHKRLQIFIHSSQCVIMLLDRKYFALVRSFGLHLRILRINCFVLKNF
jgi:hypothetical protein